MTDTPAHFAEKLNALFDTVRKPDGSAYTQEEVVRGTNGLLTRVYLWKLRTGRARNPGYAIIQAVAGFFGVDPSYFFEESNDVKEQVEKAREEDLTNQIALRSSRLDEEGKQAVLGMIDYMLKSREESSTKKE
jgi:transcriptional regulator with XRE-family HTH domain